MANIPYKILEQRQKFQIKLYAFLVGALTLLFTWYFWGQFQEYQFARKGIDDGGNLVQSLGASVIDVKEKYQNKKVEFDALNREVEGKLETIFPVDDDYTTLTRQMDEIEQILAKKHDPFEVSSLNFQNVVENEEYRILPVRMNIRSSQSNFTKFLHVVEGSGALNDDLRLMDIASIRISFENSSGTKKDEQDIINFSVQINAYFQK